MKRFLSLFFQLLFCFPFILFLSLSGIENYQHLNRILFIFCIGILLVLGIGQSKFYKIDFETDKLIVIPSVLIGTIITYSIQYYIGINAILSASLVGLTASFLEKKSKYIIATPIYCGAFVGMTNSSINIPLLAIASIGLIAGSLFYLSKNFYGGIGGKLGTIAFSSVIASILIIKYLINDVSI